MTNDIFTQETVDKLNASALTFNEVVTSRAGGVSTGAIIDQTLTPLGETTDTLKGRLDKLGVHISGWASTDGGTLTSPAQAFLNNTAGSAGFGNYYSWSGEFPKTVAPGSDPAAVGSGFVPRTDIVLRPVVLEAMRRSYAEAGYNLVQGSFEKGGVLASTHDVLLYEKDGKAYSWTGVYPSGGYIVSPNTDPTTVGFIAVHSALNRDESAMIYSQIRAYKGVSSKLVCSGKNFNGDGAGGVFFVDLNDSSTVDDGVVTLIDALGRRWKRDHTKGEVHLLWATGKILPGISYTAEFEAAVRASSRYTNGNPIDARAGTVILPSCDILLRDAWVKNPGLVLKGMSNNVSRIVGDTEITLTVQPLRNDVAPFTNPGYGAIVLQNVQFCAVSDVARNSGIGLLLINCFAGKFSNSYFAGFKKSVVMRGCHFINFDNSMMADESSSFDNPNLEIYNRGYAISVDTNSSAGEIESSSFKIDGGWFNNTSFDFDNASNHIITDVNIGPASKTILVGYGSRWSDNRFENLEQFALAGKYDRFPWFTVSKDDNIFENNAIHSFSANSDPLINPKFLVTGNNNKFDFSKECIHYGIIYMGPNTHGNHVTLGDFVDLKLFGETSGTSIYSVENAHIFMGRNSYTLKHKSSKIDVSGSDIKIKSCTSIAMPSARLVQGFTVDGKTHTVTDASGNMRIILNYNSTTNYTYGVYALKFRVKCSSEHMKFKVFPTSTRQNANKFGMQQLNDCYVVVRFEISQDDTTTIQPAIVFEDGLVGDSLELSEIELLKLDGGKYTETLYAG